jgi:ribonucleoside-diphosphate reductase alpha chain
VIFLLDGLEELIDYQDYPVRAAESVPQRLVDLLVLVILVLHTTWQSMELKYDSQEAWDITHESYRSIPVLSTESHQIKLAKEKGACARF